MNEIHNQREIEHLQSEITRLEHEKRSAALDWMAAAGQYEDEIARLRSALAFLYEATTNPEANTAIPAAIREASAALGGGNG